MEWIQQMDQSIAFFIQQHLHAPFLDPIMVVASFLGNVGILWILVAVAFLLSRRYRKFGMVLGCALLLCFLVGNVALKNLVARQRPCVLFPQVPLLVPIPHDFSFPSGHTMTSFASAAVIFFANRKWGVVAYLLAGLIAFSRLYLFVHFFTDVLVGGVLGVAFGLLLAFLFKKFHWLDGLLHRVAEHRRK